MIRLEIESHQGDGCWAGLPQPCITLSEAVRPLYFPSTAIHQVSPGYLWGSNARNFLGLILSDFPLNKSYLIVLYFFKFSFSSASLTPYSLMGICLPFQQPLPSISLLPPPLANFQMLQLLKVHSQPLFFSLSRLSPERSHSFRHLKCYRYTAVPKIFLHGDSSSWSLDLFIQPLFNYLTWEISKAPQI